MPMLLFGCVLVAVVELVVVAVSISMELKAAAAAAATGKPSPRCRKRAKCSYFYREAIPALPQESYRDVYVMADSWNQCVPISSVV
ncbi:hypothetical protein PVAP13_8NG230501 [Panicum virgatum]|uniref:Secreted protein n=1 Tax=Panicum virgatum TaxID=38727 RepID=A0A8T0P7E7_PANVG|nr:hypothetical protein PVAP13_8NG230501 [Panicum virgatum]